MCPLPTNFVYNKLQIYFIAGVGGRYDFPSKKLEISLCRELRSLPSSIQRLTNLSSLLIGECPYLKKQCKRETEEDWQYINHIPEIHLFFPMKPTFCGKFRSVLFTSLPNVSLCPSKLGSLLRSVYIE